METTFWHNKWQNQEIGFHNQDPHPLLTEHFKQLKVSSCSRIFVPLCGKSVDLVWLAQQGYEVIGAELSDIAVTEFFDELKQTPSIESIGELKKYTSDNITIYQGDIFALTKAELGKIDAVYDRAALIALPEAMRNQYSQHLLALTEQAKQLLISVEYDQSQMDGPPFSLCNTKVLEHYQNVYSIQKLDEQAYPGGLRGEVEAIEIAWLMESV